MTTHGSSFKQGETEFPVVAASKLFTGDPLQLAGFTCLCWNCSEPGTWHSEYDGSCPTDGQPHPDSKVQERVDYIEALEKIATY